MKEPTIVQMPDIKITDLKTDFSEFENLCAKIKNEIPLISYDIFKENGTDLEGVGPATMIKKLGKNNIKIYNYDKSDFEIIEEDFAGFYMFYKDNKPEYCGISRNVLKRLSDHTKGEKQSATFAHRLLMSDSLENDKKLSNKTEKEKLGDYKQEVLSYQFKLIKFYSPCLDTPNRYTMSTEHKEEVLMYLFEVFASVYFRTKHNSFRTH